MVETVVPMAVQSDTVGSQVVCVEQVSGPQLVVIAQFVIVALVHVDVLSAVVLSVVVLFNVVLPDVAEVSDVEELSKVDVTELSSVCEFKLSVGSESEPCVPSGDGIPPLISIKDGKGDIPGIGGSTNLPSSGPNRKKLDFSNQRKWAMCYQYE